MVANITSACEHESITSTETSVPTGKPASSGATRIVGALLLAQAMGLLLLGLAPVLIWEIQTYLIKHWNWLFVPDGQAVFNKIPLPTFTGPLSQVIRETPLRHSVCVLLGLLALGAAIGFFNAWRPAWVTALLVQMGSLMVGIGLYFVDKTRPFYVYLLMLSGIVMTLYLNYTEVAAPFVSRASTSWTGKAR